MSNEEKKSNRNSEQEGEKQLDDGGELEKIARDIENLPPEEKRFIDASLSIQSIFSPSVSPILEKINEQHISQILEIAAKDDERAFADLQSSRKYAFINTIILVVAFGILTVFLVNKDVALYQEILKIIIIFGGGFGSGFGFKLYQDRKSK